MHVRPERSPSPQARRRPTAARRLAATALAPVLAHALGATTASAQVGTDSLSAAQVAQILGQAGSQMDPPAKVNTGTTTAPAQAAAVVDREGTILGIFASRNLQTLMITTPREANLIITLAVAKARTGAFFQSDGEAFTTRTARFIVQDEFPQPVRNTGGGPLYGVEFSSLIGTDILLPTQTPAVSGDPGGLPLFVNRTAVGGLGVAGDFHDVKFRQDAATIDDPNFGGYDATFLRGGQPAFFDGQEERDFDEAVAMAGALGFMAPADLRATKVSVNGLRFPFAVEKPAKFNPTLPVEQLTAAGRGGLVPMTLLGKNDATLVDGQAEKINAVFDGVPGLLRNQSNKRADGTLKTDPQDSDPIRAATDANVLPAGDALTVDDVNTVITQAVHQAKMTRAGIRRPLGSFAVVHAIVIDTTGTPLGAFRMQDGTNFSYDVAVQKARTALFFSDDTHAFSCRAVGFMSQRFFPPGISGAQGPLFHVQNEFSQAGLFVALKPQVASLPIKNGITIFPGGEPLYKNGKLVGAIGVSGDGVDQDDIISFAGTAGFRPKDQFLSDQLTAQDIQQHILGKLSIIVGTVPMSFDALDAARANFANELGQLRLPYVKFPRNPRT